MPFAVCIQAIMCNTARNVMTNHIYTKSTVTALFNSVLICILFASPCKINCEVILRSELLENSECSLYIIQFDIIDSMQRIPVFYSDFPKYTVRSDAEEPESVALRYDAGLLYDVRRVAQNILQHFSADFVFVFSDLADSISTCRVVILSTSRAG